MSPLAGSRTACGMDRTKSGFGILQLSDQRRGSGASLLSPAGAFASAQDARVVISAELSEASFANFPTAGSANHGGIDFSSTARRIAPAKGRVCSYDSKDMGAMDAERWQLWQCC